jgi:hypothetical protein
LETLTVDHAMRLNLAFKRSGRRQPDTTASSVGHSESTTVSQALITPPSKRTGIEVQEYLTKLRCHGNADPDARTVRLVARSADSEAVRSIWRDLELLRDHAVELRAVFSSSPHGCEYASILKRYADVFGPATAIANIRLANFARSEQLVEFVQFGRDELWAEMDGDDTLLSVIPPRGDRTALNCCRAAADASFQMIWAISDVPVCTSY